jgi:hypothetical protein
VALMTIGAVLIAGAGSAAETSKLPWSSVMLHASRLGNTATIEVVIEVLPAASEIPKFINSKRGQALTVSGAELQRLTVATTLDIIGGKRVRLENQLWLDPLTHTPLYLICTRSGLKDYFQRFRFTREGVFRQQREPASAGELETPPEAWTKLGEHFYPYPAERAGCSPIIETSMLIPLMGTSAVDPSDASPALCVFHKRQVHRVRVHPQPVQEVGFDYLEKSADCEQRRVGSVSARGVQITSRPIGSYRGDVENFFRDGTQLWFNPEGRFPLVVKGELALIGPVELRLKEIHLK